MVAKSWRNNLRVRPTRVNRCIHKILKTSSTTAHLPQGNLGAHKVNLTKDNLWVEAVPHFRIKPILLGSQDNPICNRANLALSKAILLGSQDNPICNRANLALSKAILLGSQDNPICNRANLALSKAILLGSRDSLIFNKVNPLFSKVTLQDNLVNPKSNRVNR